MVTLRQPWTHYEECPQALLYKNWRAYVELVFPNRVCPIPVKHDGPETFPDTY